MGEELIDSFSKTASCEKLVQELKSRTTIELKRLVGSAFSVVASSVVKKTGGVHVFVMDNKDDAAYLCNDFYTLVGDERVCFFPSSYKRSVQFGGQDSSGIIQRTSTLNALKDFKGDYLIVCTYPEALVESVVEREEFVRSVLKISQGEKLSQEFVVQVLSESEFTKVDFVSEPGQYSLRGGIIDVFSYSENKPYRLDFFGDEVDSIRRFEIASQLSIEKLEQVDIVPNTKDIENSPSRMSFANFVGEAKYWFSDLDHCLKKFTDIRTKVLAKLEQPSMIDNYVTGAKTFITQSAKMQFLLLTDKAKERVSEVSVDFDCSPQPEFNKKFELLLSDINSRATLGYKTYILSQNKMQIERLDNIMHSLGEKKAVFEALDLRLHTGFISHELKTSYYTDHQIFERYDRYTIKGQFSPSESLTIAELNSLKVGDYVTHIDHGVGRYGGLVRTTENGKTKESIKLVYRDNDVLFVNVHSLHRISRYKDKDSEAPKIYKLGSGAWQKLKNATKKAVKDIARELIALYSKRKASEGFAFSPDTYMQEELEASFMYEDTPDQNSAIAAVKKDMESSQPMDRLVCGDVGFGKTEVAMRAAFKAVADSKQVAVLVPTTILALQHYRSFSKRMRDFPVRVEHISRVKTTKEVNQIKKDLIEGRIDILIGTHKILGKEINFKSLGLLIIDEEQKFGVSAKEKLRQMKVSVDTLTLTATPIPRTLQFSLMGSRDLSVINTPPANRQPIATYSHVFDEQIISDAINEELSRGGQVYFVHNRVQDILQVEAMLKRLVPTARVVVGHGQMNPSQLEKIIMDFIYGQADIFLATTIIENGIDISNANTIIINDAHRFGLSDLHQLRGRVGRSNRKAFCYLLSPPNEVLTDEARRRLRAIEEFSELGSGFNIAMQDLDIRGAGNILGGEQSGYIADIGFETYQKILNEAIQEMKAEDEPEQELDENTQVVIDPERRFITDSHIEIEHEALLPDSYVSQTAEKIKLYREIDAVTSPEQIEVLAKNLTDRFGEMPVAAKRLLQVVTLRSFCVKLGFEKAKVKNGLMILQFIENQQSAYYKSPLFMAIMRYISDKGSKFLLRQSNNRIALTVRDIKDINSASEELEKMWSKILEG